MSHNDDDNNNTACKQLSGWLENVLWVLFYWGCRATMPISQRWFGDQWHCQMSLFCDTNSGHSRISHTHTVPSKSPMLNLCVLFISQNSQQRVAYLRFRLRLRLNFPPILMWDPYVMQHATLFLSFFPCITVNLFWDRVHLFKKYTHIGFCLFLIQFGLVWFNVRFRLH